MMEMLEDIGLEEHVEDYIRGQLDENRKVMGLGHRVYKVEDPRTKHLRGIVGNLCHRERTMNLYNKCIKIEEIVHEKRRYTQPGLLRCSGHGRVGDPQGILYPVLYIEQDIWVGSSCDRTI